MQFVRNHPVLFTLTAALACWLLVLLQTSTASPFAAAPRFDADVDSTLDACNLRHPMRACARTLDLPPGHVLATSIAGTLRAQAGAIERRVGPFESFEADRTCRSGDRMQLGGRGRYFLGEVELTVDLLRTDGRWHVAAIVPRHRPLRCD